MVFDLKNRNFPTLLDFSPGEIRYLLDLASELKLARLYDAIEYRDFDPAAASIVFQQADNRMHTIKAVMVATLAH